MTPQKESRLLRIGILGAGPIAQYAHLVATQKARNATLHALCDAADDLLQPLADYYKARKRFRNYEEMLDDPALEAVIIATADAFHVPAAMQALAAGKHVLVEKPLGISIANCQELQAAVDRSDCQLQVGHMKRFDPGIAFARRFVVEELGEMIAYKGWYCDASTRYDATDSVHPVTRRSNQALMPSQDPKADRPAYYLLAHGSHLLDTARFLAGEILSVQARRVERAGIYSWFIDTEFASGSLGHLDLTVAIKGDWHEGFHLYGTQGSAFGKTFNPWYHRSSEVRVYAEAKGGYEQPLDNRANPYQLQLEAFADSILHGKAHAGSKVADGLASVQGLVAIQESVRSGKRIYLDQVSGAI